MANNQMINFNTQDVANMYRRNQLAQALQERANAPTPVHTFQGFQAPVSPLTGLTKALDMYSVLKNEQNQEEKYQGEKLAQEQKLLDENSKLERGRENFVSNLNQPVYSETQMPDARSSIESGISFDQPRPDVGTGQYTSIPKTDQQKLVEALSNIGNPNQLISGTAKVYAEQFNNNIKEKALIDRAVLTRQNVTDDYAKKLIDEKNQASLENEQKVKAGIVKFEQDKVLKAMELKKRDSEGQPTKEQEQKVLDALSKDQTNANNLLASFNAILESAEAVRNSPGLPDATGKMSYIPTIRGSDASVAETRMNNLKSKITLLGKELASASGSLGNMAIQEYGLVRDMVASLDPEAGMEEYLGQVSLAEDLVKGMAARIRESYNNHHSNKFGRFPQFANLKTKEELAEPLIKRKKLEENERNNKQGDGKNVSHPTIETQNSSNNNSNVTNW